MKLYKKLLLTLIATLAVPAIVQAASLAQTKTVMNVAQQKLTVVSEESTVDKDTEQQIDDLIDQIAVPKNIAEYAQECNWTKVLELAGKKDTNLNAQAKHGETALMFATASANWDIINALIKSGANVNIKDNYGYTALMVAARTGFMGLVEILVEAGADISATNQFKQTALDIVQSGYAGYLIRPDMRNAELLRIVDYLQKRQQQAQSTNIKSKL